MTLVEVQVAMIIAMVALALLGQTVASVARTRAVNHEHALAARETRNVLERMNGEDFFDLFALYNADPADDPDGVGTAPGATFAVRGLQPQEGAAAVGTLRFPSLESVLTPGTWELREDVVDRRLGMPRDLNLDGLVDTLDHAGDYCLLPIQVEVRWRGKGGNRSHVVFTMLSEMRL